MTNTIQFNNNPKFAIDYFIAEMKSVVSPSFIEQMATAIYESKFGKTETWDRYFEYRKTEEFKSELAKYAIQQERVLHNVLGFSGMEKETFDEIKSLLAKL